MVSAESIGIGANSITMPLLLYCHPSEQSSSTIIILEAIDPEEGHFSPTRLGCGPLHYIGPVFLVCIVMHDQFTKCLVNKRKSTYAY